ncbi:MAG: hypothetical protein RLZZ519_1061 [Bacteroidota bacterium]|jgi:4-amino-4-deoxy-L-arabinose transferase-like glycosyltransferase
MQLPWKKYGWGTTIFVCLVAAMHCYFLVTAWFNRSYLTDDSIQYLTLAQNMANEGIFSQSFSPPMVQDLQRTPGYPVFLLLASRSPIVVLLLQHFMVLGAAWFLYRIGLDLYGSRIAAAGGKLYLIQPYPMIFASYFLSEVPFVFFLIVATWAYLRFWKGAGWPMLSISLVMLSIAALIRPVALPLLVMAVILAMLHSIWLSQQRLLQAALAILVPAILLGPWFIRNEHISGRFVFSTMGEMGMVHGRIGGLEAWRTGKAMNEHQFYMAGDSIAGGTIPLVQLRTYAIGKQTHETEILSQGMTSLTLKFFLAHPWDAIRFEFWAFWQMFKGLGYGWAVALTHSKLAASVAAFVQLICNVLVLLGAFLALMRRKEWGGAERLVTGAILLMILVSSAAWADGRYRMVVDPLILILAMFTLRRQERIHNGTTWVATASES